MKYRMKCIKGNLHVFILFIATIPNGYVFLDKFILGEEGKVNNLKI